jgi:hypothetical protein
LSLSDRGVLLGTFLLALGFVVVVLLVRAGWRRSSWRWRYRGKDVPDALQWWLDQDTALGSNGTAKDDAEAVTVAPRPGADAPTGR